ncbi:hypothetical protein EJB05_46209, partial [Eragrostis curvula]
MPPPRNRRRLPRARPPRRRPSPTATPSGPPPPAARPIGASGAGRSATPLRPRGAVAVASRAVSIRSSEPSPPPSPSLARRRRRLPREASAAAIVARFARAAGLYAPAADGSDDEGFESEGNEEEEAEAAAFFTGMFGRDGALRGHYEAGWEAAVSHAWRALGGRREGEGEGFRGCVGLVQPARDASRNERPGAHRALAAIVCRVLGWDIERLPSIVIDPAARCGASLAARAQSVLIEAKVIEQSDWDVETEMKDSNTDGDGAANELVPKESVQMESGRKTGPLQLHDSSKNNVFDHETIQEVSLKNPITLMSHVTPVMAIATLVLSLLLDPWSDFQKNAYFDDPWHIMRSCLLMLIGGSLAFFMVLTEYILVSVTSAITVTIAGVVKEAVTILVAVFYFHDEFTWLKGAGLVTIMVGVSLFNWYKYEKFKRSQTNEDDVNSPPFNGDAKYIILDDLEYQDEEDT